MKQNTPEWLALRKNYIGASDSPIIMGVSPFKRSDGRPKTPYVLWQEKLDLLPPEKENSAMRFGKENEETARKEYEKITGDLMTPDICFHKTRSYMMASLDGINLTGDMIVEIKNAGKEDHEEARNKRVPKHYYPQLQHQMSCANLDHMHYFSFNQGEGVIVEVDRDEDYLEEMHEKEAKFWDNLSNFSAPPLTNLDFVERGDRWAVTAHELFTIKKDKRELISIEKEKERLLVQLSEGRSSFNGSIRYVTSSAKGSVDYGSIPQLKGVDLEKYRKAPVEKWYLSVSN